MMKRIPSMIFVPSFLLVTILSLCLMMNTCGCTTSQVNGVVNGTNEVIDNVFTPVIDHQSGDALGPYIRLGFTWVRNALYQFVDLARLFAPNAGEPVAPSTQPDSQ